MTPPKVRRRLTAILAADVAGYSGLVAADEDGTLSQFAAHLRDLIQPLVAEHDGRVIKTTGDGLLVEFASVVSALQCAMQIQAGMVKRNAPLAPARRLEFRMGLHAADVVIDSGDIFGEGVNVAARLEGLADPGGVCVSARVQEDTYGRLKVEFDDLGEQALKNMPRPVRVYSVRREGAPARPAVLALPDKPSIAVLPFQNMSGDPEQEYFAEAITEDLTTALSRWRWFFVIARGSSSTFKDSGLDPKRIGRDLGVRYLLDGSVRKAGARMRISVQLIDASNASHVWAERFDRDLVDILALQDEITEQVVAAIEPAMLRSEGVRVARKNLNDYTALDCFHRGMWHLHRVSAEGYRESIALFREAITRDPNLAAGYIGLARILYGAAAVYGWSTDRRKDLEDSRQAALTAISLDPRDAYGHYALSGSALYLGLHEEALEAAQRAVVLNPNFALGYARLGQVLTFVGRPAEAVAPIERSLRHSPFDPQRAAILASLSLAHYQNGDYVEGVAAAKASLQHDPHVALAVLAACLARLGRFEEVQHRMPAETRQQLFRQALRIVAFANEADHAHYVDGLHLAGMAAAG